MSTVPTVESVIKHTGTVLQYTESAVKIVDSTITASIMYVVTFFVHQSKQILKFLIEKNIISAGIAIIVGSQVGQITGAFVENLLSPFINLILAGETKHLEDYQIEMYGVYFKVGKFLSTLIQFTINMTMVYYIFKVTQLSSSGFNSFLGQSAAANAVAMGQ